MSMANGLEAWKTERKGEGRGGKLEKVDTEREDENGRERAGWYCKWLRILYNWERTLAGWAGRAWNFWCSSGQIWISESFQRNSVGSRSGRGVAMGSWEGEERRKPAASRDDAAHAAAPGTQRQLWEIAEKPINFAADKQRFERIHGFRYQSVGHACIVSDHRDQVLWLGLQLNFVNPLSFFKTIIITCDY